MTEPTAPPPKASAADWLKHEAHDDSSHEPQAPARVTVVDINMPFASMVGFMVKWAVAAIPAMFILFLAGIFCAALLGAIGMSLR
jgi:hypothetical protein